MEMNIIAPILRGAFCQGETGPVVRKTENIPAGDVLEISLDKEMDNEAIAGSLAGAAASYMNTNNQLPAAVNIPGEAIYMIDGKSRPGRMSGKVALVTGGAQGFGEEIVRNLFDAGAFVYIADLNVEKASSLADELNKDVGTKAAMALKVDVTSEESVANMAAEVSANTGGLDIFVNNAGVLRAGSVKTLSRKDFEFVTSVNYTAYFTCVKFFAPLMALQNLATGKYYTDIIQINSKSGLAGSNKNGAYAGGKFGGIGLTQSFALELVEDNIKVNSICPGNFFDGPLWSDPDRGLFVQYLNTGKVPGAKTIEDVKKFYEAKVPMKRGCLGDDVAKAIFYVVDQKYETGQAVPVTGGQIMLN